LQIIPEHTVCVAKDSLKWAPFFGLMWYASGNIFIERDNPGKARTVMNSAVRRMNETGDSIWIFPEGTRNPGDKMLPFKKGAFHTAVQAQVPIVAAVVSPASHALSWPKRTFPGGHLYLRVLPPFETKGLKTEDVDGLIAKVHAEMSRTLAELKELNDRKHR
jgi:1-acyl-sn-glycerol-3-phosphate acyltransferase